MSEIKTSTRGPKTGLFSSEAERKQLDDVCLKFPRFETPSRRYDCQKLSYIMTVCEYFLSLL